MQKSNKTVHLICNAHLDPVWLWEWGEGAAEAVSTFRTAAELCESDGTFIFNHNEVILYKWVQEYEPELFRRIQNLVKAGRWHIMGGWYLQPDCNMPSGESLVRQILLGRAYFKKYFAVAPTTAINFDPFGHTRGLVQILAKCGYDSYLFGRPGQDECPLPASEFIWTGYDGSEVLATRFRGWYNTPLGQAREVIEARIAENSNGQPLAVLWGVGNHGGGPSRADLHQVNTLIEETRDCRIRHSTPEAYFQDLSRIRDELPRHEGDLNRWAVGCYTSQVRIKQKHRLLENELFSLEKMASAASVQDLMEYPAEEIQDALHDLMMSEFHDILPGSSIEPAEETAIQMMDHGLEIVSRVKLKAFFALASGQRKAREGEIPIFVYNHHPFKVKTLIEGEFNLPDFKSKDTFTDVEVYHEGRLLPCQVEKELSNLASEWRKRVVFLAELEPGRMNRFDCRLKVLREKPASELRADSGRIVFMTKDLEVVINTRTGLVDRYRIHGKDLTGPKAFEPLVLADNEDPWGMTVNSFGEVIGRFTLMSKGEGTAFSGLKSLKVDSVRVIEDGPVRSVVEAVFAYGNSFLCQRYKLPKSGTEVEVEIRLHWNEKNKMLKLAVPTAIRDAGYLGQVAYGREELPNTGIEAVAQKWVAVVSEKEDGALTCINNGTYGSDFSSHGLRLTLLRSPAYSSHPDERGSVDVPQDRYQARIDQGQRHFRFWFNGGKVKERLERIDREALEKNERLFMLSFFPGGRGKTPKPLAVLEDDVVLVTAIKQAEEGDDLIVRLFEPTGESRSTALSLPALGKKLKVNLSGFEIKTLKVSVRTGRIREVNLLESEYP